MSNLEDRKARLGRILERFRACGLVERIRVLIVLQQPSGQRW